MPSKACGRSPATCCSGSPIPPSSGRWSTSRSAISARWPSGKPVVVKARSFPGREFPAKISVVYPQVNRETRTARVRIELPNPDLALLPDMYVDAEINTGSPAPVLAVPDSAVLDTGSRQAVLVDKGEGRFEPRDVKLGHRGDGYVEIRKGVAEGEPVVVSANFLIDAESNLKAALKGFSEAGGQP